MPSKSCTLLRPRMCLLEKGDNGYGFHLHGEKGKTGQFIRLVEPDSPSETSGLRAGDRLVFVNGENVESASHQQVVSRIRATAGMLELIVVDLDTEQLLKKHNIKCLKEFATDGIPVPYDEEEEESEEDDLEDESETPIESTPNNGTPIESTPNGTPRASTPNGTPRVSTPNGTPRASTPNGTPRESTPVPEDNGEIHSQVEKMLRLNSEKEAVCELRPRLCVIQRGQNGYGFNLHSEKARPGQYVRAVDLDSPAQRSGLLPGDRIVQVNGLVVEGRQHSDVVSAIKAGGAQTTLLVVDSDTDAFFKRCHTAATPEHITGPLPVPVINRDMEDKVNGREVGEVELTGLRDSTLSVSPSPSNTSSNTSLATPPCNTPPPEVSESVVVEAIPGLSLSLQQVKERAHQKRSNKRAPPMDWNKKNELFSNL